MPFPKVYGGSQFLPSPLLHACQPVNILELHLHFSEARLVFNSFPSPDDGIFTVYVITCVIVDKGVQHNSLSQNILCNKNNADVHGYNTRNKFLHSLKAG